MGHLFRNGDQLWRDSLPLELPERDRALGHGRGPDDCVYHDSDISPICGSEAQALPHTPFKELEASQLAMADSRCVRSCPGQRAARLTL